MDTEISTSLDLRDIKALATIIEVCVGRGALKANELSVVGQVYDKLTATLQQAVQQNSDSK